MRYEPARGMSQIPQFVEWRKKFEGRRLRATAVKIFQDGVIESAHGGAPGTVSGGKAAERGLLNVELEDLKPLAAELDRLGFQIHVHAIGDRAIQTTLDAARVRPGAERPPRLAASHRSHSAVRSARHCPLSAPGRRGELSGVLGLGRSVHRRDDASGPWARAGSRWLYPVRSVARTGP